MPRETIVREQGVPHAAARKVVRWAQREVDLGRVFGGCAKTITAKAIEQFLSHMRFFIKRGEFPPGEDKFKREDGELFYIKSWKYRLYGYFEDNRKTFVIVKCHFKNHQKDDKTAKNAKAVAKKRIQIAKTDTEYIDED